LINLKTIENIKLYECLDGCKQYKDACDKNFQQMTKKLAIKWIKKIHAESFPLFPDKEVKLPWFDGDEITLNGGNQIFAAKIVLQSFFKIRQKELE